MDLEQERWITIKLTPVRMQWKGYELNLIDTPGHVDFQYEVSRSLAAVEWVILLVDASQGIQAQTLSTLYQALEHDLIIIPVLNKIDLPAADPERRAQELEHLIGIDREQIIAISAKTWQNVSLVLDEIIKRIPSPHYGQEDLQHPKSNPGSPSQSRRPELDAGSFSRALIFDSIYDPYKGVVSYVKVTEWEIYPYRPLHLIHSRITINPTEVGHFSPNYVSNKKITAWQIWYVVTWLKSVRDAKVGDTMLTGIKKTKDNTLTQYSIPWFKIATPFIFAWVYPLDTNDYNKLLESIEKLIINDSAISYEHEKSNALGQWFRCWFLGTLHMDIVSERLKREFKTETIFTLPNVTYLVKIKQFKSNEKMLSWYNIKELITSSMYKHILKNNQWGDKTKDLSPEEIYEQYYDILKPRLVINSWADMPENGMIEEILEPFSHVEIVWPEEFTWAIMQLCQEYRAIMKGMEYLDKTRLIRKYDMPMGEIIIDFYDKLKSSTKWYATMNYEFAYYLSSDLVRLDLYVNNERVESLSMVSHKNNAYHLGKNIVTRLKELIPKHLFPIPIQAGIGTRIVARETISAMRKDVIAKCYGGDVSRKRKLLSKQKEGKKKMKAIWKVSVPQDIFIQLLKR